MKIPTSGMALLVALAMGLPGIAAATAATQHYRGKFFELRFPAEFKATPLGAAKRADADGATFSAPSGRMEFYIYAPQWSGEAPGIALNPASERESGRRSASGRSSDVAGTFTWHTITAHDGSYTRTYQTFLAADGGISWVIGMKYRGEADLARHRADYAAFKSSLRQFSD